MQATPIRVKTLGHSSWRCRCGRETPRGGLVAFEPGVSATMRRATCLVCAIEARQIEVVSEDGPLRLVGPAVPLDVDESGPRPAIRHPSSGRDHAR